MRRTNTCMGASMFCLILLSQAGCVSEKMVLSCSEGMHSFNVIVKAEKAPFSNDANTYWHLRVPEISYSSGQISNLLVFWLEEDQWGFLFEDIDGNRNLLTTIGKSHPIRIETASDFYKENSHSLLVRNMMFNILGESHSIKNVQCTYFHWTSGGIYYWGYESIGDGLASAFGRMKSADKNPNNSGYVPFVNWNPHMKDWPTVK